MPARQDWVLATSASHVELDFQPRLQWASQYSRSAAKKLPTLMETLSAAPLCVTRALALELYVLPLSGPKVTRMLSRAMETNTSIGSTERCLFSGFEEKVAISKISFRFSTFSIIFLWHMEVNIQCLFMLCSSVMLGLPNKMVSNVLYFCLIFRDGNVSNFRLICIDLMKHS